MNAFEQFVFNRQRDLKRIASHTRGEHAYPDVVNESWLMAEQLRSHRGVTIDFLDPGCQDLLLSYLYQHLVRYGEQNVRLAVRLDHAHRGSDDEDAVHSLINTLVSDDGDEPMLHLMAIERAAENAAEDTAKLHSLAGAYVLLLRRFDNRMRTVADHLLISLSYAYRRCAQARWLAVHQTSINLEMLDSASMLGPWRRCRFVRVPMQMAFAFEDDVLFPDLESAHEPR